MLGPTREVPNIKAEAVELDWRTKYPMGCFIVARDPGQARPWICLELTCPPFTVVAAYDLSIFKKLEESFILCEEESGHYDC
jgi:hypothetical protein